MILYRARFVVPVAAPPIADGAVAVEEGRIVWIGPARTAPAGERRDLGDVVLTPGLVNVHTHLELTAMRGFLETESFPEWVGQLTRARREVLTDELMLRSARAGIAEGVRAGIATFGDTGASGTPIRAMRESGVRGVAYHEVFGPDPSQRDASMAGLREALDRLAAYESDLVTLGVSPHAPYSVSAELYAAVADLSRDTGRPVAIHCAESVDETRYVEAGEGAFADMQRRRGIDVRGRGISPVTHLRNTGVLSRRPLLIHCVRVDDRDIGHLREHDCAVAHCPVSNAKLGHGIAPLASFRAAGLRVGIGTDSMASNNRMDVLEEARIAVLLARALSGRHDMIAAEDVIRMATLEGAIALGLDREIGTLEPGKSADLAAFSLGSPRAVGACDPVAALGFSLTGADAVFTVVAGQVLYDAGEPNAKTSGPDDLGDISAALRAWRERARS